MALACLLVAAWISYHYGKLSRAGAVAGLVVGGAIYLGAGWAGLGLLMAFFGLGIGTTFWKARRKHLAGLLEGAGGVRGWRNVLANGGVAALMGTLAVWIPERETLFQLMLGASLAAATSDTVSSELGNVYGRRYLDLRTGRLGERGQDGVVSPEGTLAGLLAAVAIGWLFLILFPGRWQAGMIVAGCGFGGNLVDSLLGATWQRSGWLDNHLVNVLNTLAAALLAGIMGLLWPYWM